MIESAIIGGGSGVLAGEALDLAGKSESEKLLNAIEELTNVNRQLLATYTLRNAREREQTPTVINLSSIFGGATVPFNPSSTFRALSLLVFNLHNAVQSTRIAIGSRTVDVVLPASDLRQIERGLFPLTLNAGVTFSLTALTGASIIAFLNGYYERRENMGRNTIEPMRND